MTIKIEINEQTLKRLVMGHIAEKTGGAVLLEEKDCAFEVKTNQNYKAEWELGSFRLTVKKAL